MSAVSNVAGFHPGELAVQRRAGVALAAARLEGMLGAPHLDGGVARFLAQRQFAVLTAHDAAGRLWSSPLLGDPGFLQAYGSTLEIHAPVRASDPLAALGPGGQAGLVAVEFAIRRRFRVNGALIEVDRQGLVIRTDQAFGNCPSYIQRRIFEPADGQRLDGSARFEAVAEGQGAGSVLSDEARSLIRGADTFFLGTVHPERGADTSHKGGLPGFVRVEGDGLWWPDYAGNNMFNSLGNIIENPEASLLFIDFPTGRTLQLSGTAELEWIEPGAPGDDGETGRRVRFRPLAAVIASLPIRSAHSTSSEDNPELKD
jgi:uncharacterized protein